MFILYAVCIQTYNLIQCRIALLLIVVHIIRILILRLFNVGDLHYFNRKYILYVMLL